jgi:hypothetical protein
MNAQDASSAVAAVFISGMIWLRTRMYYTYSQRGAGPLHLERAGRYYFGAAIAVLAIGWFAAPLIGRAAWPAAASGTTLMRVLWFLGTYYIFIAVHRILQRRGVAIFVARPSP